MFRSMMYKMMVFMSKHMMACDEASFLISYRCDKKLGFKRWMQLKLHLLSCHLCMKYASQIEELNTSIDHYREQCSSESCHHHLPEDCRSEMELVVSRELKAK